MVRPSSSTRAETGTTSAAALWAEHDRCARELLAQHGGREIDRSDGLFALFDRAVDATRYALAYHEALSRLELRARCGLHVGTVALRDNRPEDVALGAKPTEVDGRAKPLAARVMSLATGGQTLLTDAARHALGAALPSGTALMACLPELRTISTCWAWAGACVHTATASMSLARISFSSDS